jgi:hypothetical protein
MQRSGGSLLEANLRQIVLETLSQKPITKKVLVEWLKVKALRSNPSTEKKTERFLWSQLMCVKVSG